MDGAMFQCWTAVASQEIWTIATESRHGRHELTSKTNRILQSANRTKILSSPYISPCRQTTSGTRNMISWRVNKVMGFISNETDGISPNDTKKSLRRLSLFCLAEVITIKSSAFVSPASADMIWNLVEEIAQKLWFHQATDNNKFQMASWYHFTQPGQVPTKGLLFDVCCNSKWRSNRRNTATEGYFSRLSLCPRTVGPMVKTKYHGASNHWFGRSLGKSKCFGWRPRSYTYKILRIEAQCVWSVLHKLGSSDIKQEE